jgi:hypothetical protein
VGAAGLTLDCGAEGFERHSFVVPSDATAPADPTGGLLVSIDMLVDPELPFGQRYDSSAAAALFQDLASGLAAGARPAGALIASVPPADGETGDDPERP